MPIKTTTPTTTPTTMATTSIFFSDDEAVGYDGQIDAVRIMLVWQNGSKVEYESEREQPVDCITDIEGAPEHPSL